MSESEAKRELTGLARSIDALFTRVPEASAPPEGAASAVADLDTLPPTGDTVVVGDTPIIEAPAIEAFDVPAFDEPDFEESVIEEAVIEEAPIVEPAIEEEAWEEPPLEESPIVEPVLEEEAGEEPLLEDSPMGEPVLEDEQEEPTLEETPADATFDDPPLVEGGGEVVDEDDEPEPGPLDLAVEAYVGGQLETASEIESLAGELLENKEIDPIARAVFRLTLAAGSPPDTSVFAVAESIMSPVVLGRLARHMGTERDQQRRQDYFSVCRVIGKDMAVAIRNDLADATNRLARRVHQDALIEMGDTSRAVIDEMAVDENRFLVRKAVAILGEIGGDRAVELVTSALANPDARVRREALLALAKLGDEDAGQLVVGLLEDPEPEVRMAAAIAAGELKVERAARSLISMLDGSKDPDQCLPVIRALGQLGDPGAVASIEKHAVRSMFSKPTTAVRIASYRALNGIGTPHARKLLNKAVSDKDPEVKAAVKDLLHMH